MEVMTWMMCDRCGKIYIKDDENVKSMISEGDVQLLVVFPENFDDLTVAVDVPETELPAWLPVEKLEHITEPALAGGSLLDM